MGIIEEATFEQVDLDESKLEISPIGKIDDESVINLSKEFKNQVTLATKKGFELNLTPAPDLIDNQIKFQPNSIGTYSSGNMSPIKFSPDKASKLNTQKLKPGTEEFDGDGTTKIDSITGTHTGGVNKSIKLASDYEYSESEMKSSSSGVSDLNMEARSNLSMN